MLSQDYTKSDLVRLTEKARTLWEYDLASTPKRIKRKQSAITDSVPLKAIYRMVVEDWRSENLNRYNFPFVTSNFSRVLGLSDEWEITVEDRKFIEKDMVLFASDGRTIIVLPEPQRRWWEHTWFNVLSLSLGILGLIFGFLK